MKTLWDFIKVIGLIIIAAFLYNVLQDRYSDDFSIGNSLDGSTKLQVTDEELWGNPSPYRGAVIISPNSTPTYNIPNNEYIQFRASFANTEAIDLSGWSLHSVVSDTKVYLPSATVILKMTGANDVQSVYLAPGEYVVLNTGSSPIYPIASSFHTNKCIGYLSQYYDFTPRLRSECNSPATTLPPTPQNITTYGSECVEFLAQADSCRSYRDEMPAHLLPVCRDYIAETFTYHSCLSSELSKNGYDALNGGGWYLYLNNEAELWRDNYEAIQLLDAQGQVVDVLRY